MNHMLWIKMQNPKKWVHWIDFETLVMGFSQVEAGIYLMLYI